MSLSVTPQELANEPSATYFAEVDRDGVVLRVLVADAKFIAKLPGTWIETRMDGATGKNYAGPGYVFDEARAAFIAPRPSSKWDLDEATATWKPNSDEQKRLDALMGAR
jgi:hypothetical protein